MPITLLSPAAAPILLARAPTVLDARSLLRFLADGHIPGSIRCSWKTATAGLPLDGRLADPDVAAATYAGMGVRDDKPVLVVGDWDRGWGEEGRVAWDLDYLGHGDVRILLGGIHAWTGPRARLPAQPGPSSGANAVFSANPRDARRVSTPALRKALASERPPLVIDARETGEFAGATPHGESRGGHIPGAVSLPWRWVLGLPPEARRVRFAAFLADHDSIVVTCTGGVRSGFVVALLDEAGVGPVANHDDGMWGWARSDAALVVGASST